MTQDTEDVVARLRVQARHEETASKMMADAKTARQTDREDAWTDAGYSWATAEQTASWKAADLIQSLSDRIDVLEGWNDAKIVPPPKTANITRAAQCFLAWCPDEDAPDGGDQRIVWWEPVMNGGCWFGDRDLVESFTHWKALGPPPARAALHQEGIAPK